MTGKAKSKGLRDALKRRQAHSTHYDLPVQPYEVIAKRKHALREAEQTLTAGRYLLDREDRPDVQEAVSAAQVAVSAAEEAFGECFHRMVFVGLPEDQFDALVQLHPPLEEQILEAKVAGVDVPMFNRDTLVPDLLQRCTQDSDLTAEEWLAEMEPWTRGERSEITAAVLAANIRSVSTSLSFV